MDIKEALKGYETKELLKMARELDASTIPIESELRKVALIVYGKQDALAMIGITGALLQEITDRYLILLAYTRQTEGYKD